MRGRLGLVYVIGQRLDSFLQLLQLRLARLKLSIQIVDQSSESADPKTIALKQEQLDQLKKDYQRKGEDAQTAYNKKRTEMFSPLQDDIGKALEAYAKAHNINVIIDGSQVPLVYAAEPLDITRAFISEFNSKNPATAVVTPPN